MWGLVRIPAIFLVLGIVFALLPDAGAFGSSSITIPDSIWLPVSGVLALGRYFPIAGLLLWATMVLALRVGFPLFWMGSWIVRHLLP